MGKKNKINSANKNDAAPQASFSERLCRTLDIQPDILPYGTLIELRGRYSVTLRGCGRVIVYTDREISFATHKGTVCVRGSRLCCSSYCKGAAVVDGLIEGVFFEGVEK
jgi:hypothetical protein